MFHYFDGSDKCVYIPKYCDAKQSLFPCKEKAITMGAHHFRMLYKAFVGALLTQVLLAKRFQ